MSSESTCRIVLVRHQAYYFVKFDNDLISPVRDGFKDISSYEVKKILSRAIGNQTTVNINKSWEMVLRGYCQRSLRPPVQDTERHRTWL